jgi:hypothetical protein
VDGKRVSRSKTVRQNAFPQRFVQFIVHFLRRWFILNPVQADGYRGFALSAG